MLDKQVFDLYNFHIAHTKIPNRMKGGRFNGGPKEVC